MKRFMPVAAACCLVVVLCAHLSSGTALAQTVVRVGGVKADASSAGGGGGAAAAGGGTVLSRASDGTLTYVPGRGETLRQIARRFYGTEDAWQLLLGYNLELLIRCYVSGSRVRLELPPPARLAALARRAGSGGGSPPPEKPTGGRVSNPIMSLNITSPDQIGPREAALILQGTGFRTDKRSLTSAYKALYQSRTYRRRYAGLTPTMKRWLFEEYVKCRSALTKYAGYPEISRKATPGLYEKWIRDASVYLTRVPEKYREPVLRSLMSVETTHVHWKNYTPVVSGAGAIGFGQFLEATASNYGINPYDPADNIKGVAIYLNDLIRRKGSLREALAAYNGGESPPRSSYSYADKIIGRIRSYV